MSLITMLSDILEAGKTEYEEIKAGMFTTVEAAGCRPSEAESEAEARKTAEEARKTAEEAWKPAEEARKTANAVTSQLWRNLLAHGDNGAFMKALLHNEDMAGTLQMVYIDPPFFSKANYDAVIHVERPAEEGGTFSAKHLAYGDIWSQGIGQYLTMLTSRLMLIRDLLREDGTVWVHLDWHAVHYVRILMDEIFGADHFVNEIIWTYKSGGAGKKHFARKHDTILVYSKTKDYYFSPLKEKSYNRGFKPYHFKGVEEFQDETGWYTMVNMKDVWQIDMVGRTSAERTGYATQKPEALLERILACSSREGDLCGDFFCGSGTLAAVAQKMNRRWICCDQGRLAVASAYRRILEGSQAADWDNWGGTTFLMQQGEDTVISENLQISLKDGVLQLTGCHICLEGAGLDREDLQTLSEIAEKAPLQLIAYWTIDDSYDGILHRAKHVLLRKKGKLQTCWDTGAHGTASGTRSHGISVMAVDVLGNRYGAVLR